MTNNEALEEIAMTLIANAGGARNDAFVAIKKAKVTDFDSADAALVSAANYLQQAHDSHSQLLKLDAHGQVPCVDLLLSHAQDHFMMASLAKDLAAEIVDVYKAVSVGK